MAEKTMGFIGAGNMARCIIAGLIKDGFAPKKLWVSDPDLDKLAALQQQYSLNTRKDNTTLVDNVETVVLAVKPDRMKTVALECAQAIQAKQPLILSIAAGVRTQYLTRWLGNEAAVVRCMPNTPAMVGSGASGLYANANVSEAQRGIAESILRAVGVTLWFDNELDMDTVTALSGSGPAYFFLIMEAFEQAAIALGLSEQAAHLLGLQTALGAAHLAMQSDVDLATLRQHVTSPNGTTEAALAVLEQHNIRDIFLKTLKAARQRAIELSEQFDD